MFVAPAPEIAAIKYEYYDFTDIKHFGARFEMTGKCVAFLVGERHMDVRLALGDKVLERAELDRRFNRDNFKIAFITEVEYAVKRGFLQAAIPLTTTP